MRKLAAFVVLWSIIASLIASLAKAEPYCLALRGNGEAQPAHWGALANVVEKFGLPKAQSGGSSASISLMLLDSIAANSWVTEGDEEQQKSRAAFLLKMLHGVAVHYSKKIKNKLDKSGFDLTKLYTGTASKEQADALKTLIKNLSLDTISSRRALPEVVKMLNDLGINELSRYYFLLKKFEDLQNGIKPDDKELAKIKFYAEDLHRTLATFGAFDAESDPYIFFREGIVNFETLGFSLGKIATFLSEELPNSAFQKMTSLCEPLHAKKTWKELIASEPRCQEYLSASLEEYFNQKLNWIKTSFANKPVGSKIISFPTTAVLIDSAFDQAQAALRRYHDKLDRSVAENFEIDDLSKVRLGYWGKPTALDYISENLKSNFPDDVKSSMFLGLGQVNWLDVLRTSPAEPGLANFQPMIVDGKKAYSAGGWSDLHPVLVLKAFGCKDVIYVTRQGGESLFAQGIAKRLLNFDRDWKYLSTKNEEVKKRNSVLNDKGDKGDQSSLWSRLYNLANPKSSFKKSLSQSDLVLCTDWNKYDVKNQIDKLVEDSYRAPLAKSVNKPGCF